MFRVEVALADADRLVDIADAMRAWFDRHTVLFLSTRTANAPLSPRYGNGWLSAKAIG